MDCICPLHYQPVCVGNDVYSNDCFAECLNLTLTGWYNEMGPSGTHACSNYKQEGEYCGGFTLPEYYTRCNPDYHCINTMGQHIVDNPGVCKTPCVNGTFDHYSECIPDDCNTWFDGCNNCFVDEPGNNLVCTEMFCDDVTTDSMCIDYKNCDNVDCPTCYAGNESFVQSTGQCCGCDEKPVYCCLAMMPSCLACGTGQSLEEWCLSNQDSEWFNVGDSCKKYLPVSINVANLKLVCDSNMNAVNCQDIPQEKFDDEQFFLLFGFLFLIIIGVPCSVIHFKALNP